MRFTKIASLVVCAALLAATLSGCSKTSKSPFVTDNAKASASPAATSGAAATVNLAGAYAVMDPKTVMLKVSGKDVTWGELFFYIASFIGEIQSQGDQITDWSAPYKDEETYKDYVLNSAVQAALQNLAVRNGAEKLKVSLDDTDQSAIKADWDAQVKAAGSEDAFNSKLKAEYCTKDIYTQLREMNALAQKCFTSMYGDKGSKLSDQDVADSTAKDGYLMAKHILFSTVKTDETGNSTPLPDADKAKVKEKAQNVLNELKSYKGNDFDAYFDQLMKANSEDPGVQQFPKGYLFQSGEMVSQFEDATKALEIGKYTPELVETQFGYHIIYRIPISYDVTPMSQANYGDDSLRYVTARKMFSSVLDTWIKDLDVTYSDKYKSLDFNKLFAAG